MEKKLFQFVTENSEEGSVQQEAAKDLSQVSVCVSNRGYHMHNP